MIVKVKGVYHVYAPTKIPGKKKLIGRTTSKSQAEKLNAKTKKKGTNRKK